MPGVLIEVFERQFTLGEVLVFDILITLTLCLIVWRMGR